MDSTWCLWGGQIRDDRILEFIESKIPPCRIILIPDCCHSEANFRGYVRKTVRAVTFGAYGKRQAVPLFSKSAIQKTTWPGQIAQLAGCKENSYSYSSGDKGVWSWALLDNFDERYSWLGWFNAGKKSVTGQDPQWVEYNVNERFRNGRVLR